MSDERTDVEDIDDADVPGDPGSDDESATAADSDNRKRDSNLVYAALAAGALVLAILLLIVWLSSRGDGGTELPLCLDITADAAADAVLAGSVDSVDVLIDQSQPLDGLTAVQLKIANGECRRMPEGADNRSELYQLLGVVALYNEAGEQQVDVRYLRQEVPEPLLNTSTPEPTATIEPTATSTASPTAESTATSSPEPTMTPEPEPSPTPAASAQTASASPVPPASPVASPHASPVASPAPVGPSASPEP